MNRLEITQCHGVVLEYLPVIFIQIGLCFQVVSGMIGTLCNYGDESDDKCLFNERECTGIISRLFVL